MCGMFGLFSFSRENNYFDETLVRRTIDDLYHRGPDGNGQYIGDGTILIHTRLSFLISQTPVVSRCGIMRRGFVWYITVKFIIMTTLGLL